MDQNQTAPVAPVTPVVQNGGPAKPKGKNKTPVILCSIFGVLAAAGIGFGVYGMFFQPKPTCEPANCDVKCENKCDVPNADKGSSDGDISVITPLSIDETQALLKDKYKLDRTENRPHYDEMVNFLDNFDQSAKIIRLYWTLKDNLGEQKCEGNFGTECSRTISYETFNNYYHQYYGSADDLEKKDYTFDGISKGAVKSLNYSTADDTFTFNYGTGLGGDTTGRVWTKVINTSGTKDGFEAIVASVALAINARDAITPGSDYEQSVYSSLKVYKFNFVKEDDGFKLTSIEKL